MKDEKNQVNEKNHLTCIPFARNAISWSVMPQSANTTRHMQSSVRVPLTETENVNTWTVTKETILVFKLHNQKQIEHTRELINAQKTSYKHNNKDLSRLR